MIMTTPSCTRLTLALFIAASLLLPAGGVAAGTPNVLTGVTTGQQKIHQQNIPGAKKQAVDRALAQAVQNAFASMVSRQVFASNLEFLYDRLVPGAMDYVITYRVLDSMQYKGSYLVGVESKINLDLLETRLQDARILKAGKDRPTVLFLIAEQTPADVLPKYWWGNNPKPYASLADSTLKTELAENRVVLSVRDGDYPDPSYYNITFSSIYDETAAMDLGRALKADLVFMGRAGASESFNRMGDEKAFDAVVDIRGYDLSSGNAVIHTRTTATATSQTEGDGTVQALTQAARDAGLELGQKIDRFWSQTLRRESVFDVTIQGENFLTRFLALKRRFQNIRDIQNMQPREIGSGHAVMEITYKGSPEQFANAVLLRTFEGFGIEIAEVSQEGVNIRFVEDYGAVQSEAIPGETDAEVSTEEKDEQL